MTFPPIDPAPLGIYPIVDRARKLAVLYEAGITTAQLRIKDLEGEALEAEVIEAVELSRSWGVRFFLNDHWQLAIRHGAYGVHLGQEDIRTADLEALRSAGLRLGISSHTPEEITVALGYAPSYLAIGPIYPPLSKKLVYPPVGVDRFAQWAARATCPVVAIGGITRQTLVPLARTRAADGAALVTDILDAHGEIVPERLYTLQTLWSTHA